MNEMRQMIIDSVTKIMKDVCTKEVINESEKGVWAGELWDTLAEAGMITVGVPEELGGVGFEYEDAFEILRLAGKFAAPLPLSETYIANWLLARLGKEASDEPLTIQIPGKGEPMRLAQTDGGWLVTGQVSWVPWARHAKRMIVLGQTDAGGAVAIVPLEKARIEHGQNLAGEPRDEVSFAGAFVSDEHVIAVENLDEVTEFLTYSGAAARCVMMAGALERVLEMSVTHAKERTQFGRPLHRFQAIQQQIALLAGENVAANMAADYAVKAYAAGKLKHDIAMAKMRVGEAAGTAAAIAHQIHAAIGFTFEHTLHQSTRRLWSWRDEFGTESQWGSVLADHFMAPDFGGIWDFLTRREA